MIARARVWPWAGLVIAAGALVWSFLSEAEVGATKRGGGPRPAPVRTSLVVRGELRAEGRWPAELVADTAMVAAGVAGRVESVGVRIGDAVGAGDTLATLAIVGLEAELEAVKAALAARRAAEHRAAAELRAARRELRRAEALAEGRVTSVRALDETRTRVELAAADVRVAEAATATAAAELARVEARVEEAAVKAPFAGTVSARAVDPGAWVGVGAPIVRVVRSGETWVRFEVPEVDAASFVPGTAVGVVVPSLPGTRGTAVVTGVAAEAIRERRTIWVEAGLEVGDPRWKAGMYAEVEAARERVDAAIVVPAEAVLSRLVGQGGEALEEGVLVLETAGDGAVARWVPVEVRVRGRDAIAIGGAAAEGLLGTRVLVAGHAELPDGAPVATTDEGQGSAAR